MPRFRLLADKHPRVHADTCLICEAKRGDIPDDPKEFKHQKIRRDFDVEKRAKIQQELAYRELCRRKLLTYVQRYEPSYLAGWVHHKMAAKLEEFLERCVRGEAPRLMLFLPPRHGKLCAHDTPVLTPRGWTTHGDLRPGDRVFRPDGKPTEVVALSPEDDLAEYEVELSNGDRVAVHAHHEWAVYDRRKQKWRTVETQDIAADVWIGGRGKRGGRARWQLPGTEAVRFDRKELPLDPYVLGAWLGDGTTTKPCLTNNEEDAAVLQAAFAEAGYPYTNLYIHPDYGTHTSYFYRTDLTSDLRAAGIFGYKYIPEAYLRGSMEQRLEVLAGLMDTGGHVEPHTGRCRFVTTSEDLRDGVLDLCTTLGFRPYVSSVPATVSSGGVEGRNTVYTIGFQPDREIPVRTPRRQITRFAPRRRASVAAVRRIEGRKGRCIQVASPDGLYLVGRSLTPTHNSMLASDYFVSWAIGKYPWLEFISTSHSSGLPIKASRRIRSRLSHQSHQTLFEDTKIAHDSRNVEHWNTTANGGFLAAGVGGGITGHGAHCAHFSVPCTTRRGILPIEQVCVGDEVWGYDHDKGAECWTRVEAVSTQYKDHLVSAGGAWVTPDHQVWTEEYGYIEAARADGCTSAVSSMRGRVPSQGEVAQTQSEKVWRWHDDVLFPGVRQSTSDEAGMRLREKESPARGILRSMLPTGQACSSTVCAVRRYVQTQYSRARAQCSQAWGAFERLLLPSLLRSVPQSEPIAGGSTELLSGMWDRHTGGTSAVLQQGMLLQPGEETPRVRTRAEHEQTQGRETRRLHVHELWPGEGPDGGASHRSRRNESFNGQSDPSLRTVPQPLSSSVYGACAAGLAGALPKTAKHRVVDIQTGTGNFFANGILVHNCFIIDDPVKDAEEADSETVRENHWDWWSSTASTRVAPGGGVLYIACMTGDTPVSMADGRRVRLDEVRPGDMVLSWKDGEAVSRQVLNWVNQGEDDVFVMRTSSGRIVRANARHPFLVYEHGELKWVRVRNLRSAQRIVIKKDSGENGGVKSAVKKGATDRCPAAGSVSPTTTNGSGLQGIVHRLRNPEDSVNHTSNTAMGSMLPSIIGYSMHRMAGALCAVCQNIKSMLLNTGSRLCALTMIPVRRECEDSSATIATYYSNEETQSRFSNPPYDTDDFTTDTIVSIEPGGREEVFDIEVEDAHNFLANVIVVSNTRWHDDDLGGRMLSQEREAIAEGVPEEELENWEVISFPALAEEDEYELPDGTFMGAEGENYPKAKLIRHKDEALHRARWPEQFLRRKRRTMQPRHWSALYQQNPVPDEGITFTKDMFITQAPRIGGHNPMILLSAWDLAIGKNSHNDWTVGVVGGLDSKSNLHILDMVRGRWGTLQICEAILDLYQKYPEIQRIGIERGQLELAIKQPLESRMEERRLWPVLDRTLTPIQDKEKRAGPLQGMMQHHRVMFPPERDFPWVTRIREELLRFPAGVHDDTVDALAWLARMAYETTPPQEPVKPRHVSWKEQLKYHVASGGTKDPMAA